MADIVEKNYSGPVPGVPAASGNSASLGNSSSAAHPATDSANPGALPAGSVEDAKASVARANGLRGGRPRKDGHIPGSAEALQADRDKAAKRMRDLRATRDSAPAHSPLPSAATPEPGATPGATNQAATIPVDFAGGLPPPLVGWTPADLQPVVENGIKVGEEMDMADNRKIIAPLELDAPAQSRVLQPTRWPQSAKDGLMRGGAESLAEIFNAAGVPLAVKKHLLTMPALAYLIQHRNEQKGELRKLVVEEMRKKSAVEAVAKTE